MGLKKTIISAIVGAISWTLLLTPYMVVITKVSREQYVSWLGMQFILVPIVAPIVFWATEKTLKRFNT